MKTLKTTLSRLRHVSSQSRGSPSSPSLSGMTGSDDALLVQMARMLSEPLYGGRPLAPTPASVSGNEGLETQNWAEGIEALKKVGVEVVSGHFESSNDRLVGAFDEHQLVRASPGDWQPELGAGFQVDVGTLKLRPATFGYSGQRTRLSVCPISGASDEDFLGLAFRVKHEIERAARRFLSAQVGLSRRWNRLLSEEPSN